MIRIKICGITNSQDALWAANLGADFIGLNFYSLSPRKVSRINAKAIVSQLPPFVTPVGVFVNEEASAVANLIRSTPLKAVQFHGHESPEYCRTLKASGATVVKTISLKEPLAATDWAAYDDSVDFFLFDYFSPDTPGGTGQTLDWSWLQAASDLRKPWFLAGGLNPDNVREAIQNTHTQGVDVCSGVERLTTRKDFEAMKRFIQTVRAIQ